MIACIVVTYNPAQMPARLHQAVAAYCQLIVVDNSTDLEIRGRLQRWASDVGAILVDMRGNAGIASAQNAGVEQARRSGARATLFFDQDSVANDLAVSTLVAAVLADENTVVALLPGDHTTPGDSAPRYQPLRELMSSGSGCTLGVFDRVGGFESDLFIDCVDYEWGWRCRSNGVRLVGLRAGRFEHTLGQGHVRVLGWHAHIDSPVRGYYQFRNVTAMMLRSYVPLRWKAAQALRSLAKLGVLAFAPSQRGRRLALAARGVYDGLRGRLGPLQAEGLAR